MNLGLKRLLFVLTFLNTLIWVSLGLVTGFGGEEAGLWVAIIFTILYPIYWVLVRVVLWVYDGFSGVSSAN